MTHALSSIIDLTNAPTPPRWFEFLLEPGRLQQHLETRGCDPSPIQLINLFFRNIPSLAPIQKTPTSSGSAKLAESQNATTGSSTNPVVGLTPPTSVGSTDPSSSSSTSPLTIEQLPSNGETSNTEVCNGATNGDTAEANKNGMNGGMNGKPINLDNSEKIFNDLVDTYDAVIPPDSYEAKYRLKKNYALKILAVKVASFLKWDLTTLCNGLSIPTQYKLMQALAEACCNDTCPMDVTKFAAVIYDHWFLKSAMTYELSSLQPQSNSTTIIYLSPLQQQQQNADSQAMLSIGQVFCDARKKYISSELRKLIWDLAKVEQEEPAAKKPRSSVHPFRRANLRRPKMECFDSRSEQYNDWKESEAIEAFDLMEAACYDLGKFLFFEEDYSSAKEAFEIIRESSDKYPLIDVYLQSASDILTADPKRSASEAEEDSKNCDISSNEICARRKQTEKYLFDCMTQYSQEQSRKDTNVAMEAQDAAKTDTDLRFGQHQLSMDDSWYLSVPVDLQQQQLLEIGRGDSYISNGCFKQAMGCFVGALMLMTDYFQVFSRHYAEEEPCITRMIQCSISLSCYTQAVALCQMTKHLNYSMAFKQLNERICNDCCDDIYGCIWNVTLLEYIINLHAKRGEVERRTKVIQLLGQLELNENNPDEVLREAEHVRRGRFFRIMSNKYL